MKDQKIEKWVAKQLEKGVEPQKLKKVLKRKGYNPELVEKVTRGSSADIDSGAEAGNGNLDSPSADSASKYDKEPGLKSDENKESRRKKKSVFLRSFMPDLRVLDSISWKNGFEVTALLILVVLGAFLVNSTSVNDNFNSFADALSSEKSVADSQNNSELSGRSTVVVDLENGVAKPSRPKVSSNEKILFRNKENYTLKVGFETEKSGFRIEPDETVSKRFESITYYSASPVDAEGEKIYGSINAQ